MLYELDDPITAIRELARVLDGDGTLLATAYAETTTVPLVDIHDAVTNATDHARTTRSTFSLETGEPALRTAFDHVEVHVTDETYAITDVEELLAVYTRTGRYEAAAPTHERLADRFRQEASRRIARDGALTGTTRWTAFVARSPRVRSR